jgi:hypothetical protein
MGSVISEEHCEEIGWLSILFTKSSLRSLYRPLVLILFSLYCPLLSSFFFSKDDYLPVRMDAYKRRKERLTMKYAADEATSRSKCRFITEILKGDLDVFRPGGGGAVPEAVLIKDLRSRGYPTTAQLRAMQGPFSSSMRNVDVIGSEGDDSDSTDLESDIEPYQAEAKGKAKGKGSTQSQSQSQPPSDRSSYAYLLDLPIRSLTDVRSAMLMREAEQSQLKLTTLQSKSESDLWLADLDTLTATYDKHCM